LTRLAKLPGTLPLWHPACLLATWFGTGLLPRVPGTWGSAAALPFAWLIALEFGSTGLLVGGAIAFCIGIWAAGLYVKRCGAEDPGPVVIDEVAGQWITLAFAPVDPLAYLLGFILFRLSDILKPWPANWADRHLTGGLGAMLDDMLAALYACAAMFALTRWVL
jgi:phosphatidylglycerophosphatase A